ncbi:MAG: DUF4440 domain-containing protein [Acidobacteriales bacterium]|nr:DUF4440 domain-containing protein [Terriglobales bacterium]
MNLRQRQRSSGMTLWEHLLGDKDTTLSFAPTLIQVAKSGDMAYDVGTVEMKKGGQVASGKYVVVWRKQAGKWKAVADIFNTDK